VGSGINIQSILAFTNINCNRRLGLSRGARVPDSPLDCQKHQKHSLKTGKNDTELIPVLITFKITTFLHLEHKCNVTE